MPMPLNLISKLRNTFPCLRCALVPRERLVCCTCAAMLHPAMQPVVMSGLYVALRVTAI